MFDPRAERPRATADLFTFEFWSPQATFGGQVALWRLPSDGVAWYATAVYREGRAVVSLCDVFRLGRTLELRGDGLWADHNVEDPFSHWSVGLEAFALELDDPADERGMRVPLGYDLEWEMDPAVAAVLDDGDEQPAVVRGEVLLGSEAYDLDGFGWRSHTGVAAPPPATSRTRRRHGIRAGEPVWTAPDATTRPGDDLLGWSLATVPSGRRRSALFRDDSGLTGFTEEWV